MGKILNFLLNRNKETKQMQKEDPWKEFKPPYYYLEGQNWKEAIELFSKMDPPKIWWLHDDTSSRKVPYFIVTTKGTGQSHSSWDPGNETQCATIPLFAQFSTGEIRRLFSDGSVNKFEKEHPNATDTEFFEFELAKARKP